MKTYSLSNLSEKQIINLTERKADCLLNENKIVQEIFNEIENKGDKALRKYTSMFDGIDIIDFQVSEKEVLDSEKQISKELKQAIEIAYDNIYKFHKAQVVEEKEIETSAGVKCFRQSRPIDKIALYVPGGNAALFSTVLMLSIPAKIAGCEDITLLTPPDKDGNISPEIAYCANKCCINTIIKLGGAQAIGAVSIGTESITKVDKIFGPGNSYVTAAKLLSQNKYGISIDMPAGPSEVLIIGDQNSNPSFIASDLLSQAEHGPDSQAILILIGDQNLGEINNEINKQLKTLARKNYAQKSLEESFILIVENAKQALNFSNNYAPEHLIINLKNPKQYISKIKNAGSVFLGEFTPESAGDYASGTNHTLPTSGFAKTYSGISVDSFIKKITFQEISKDGLTKLGNTITKMAEKEGLDAHKNAVTIRLND